MYIEPLCGEKIGETIDERVPRPFDELIANATRTGERATQLAATDDPARAGIVDGESRTAGVIYAQLVHHGNEHRSQVKSILGANGIEPPGVSGWGYAIETGRVGSTT